MIKYKNTVLLDIHKAFYTVHHTILLLELYSDLPLSVDILSFISIESTSGKESGKEEYIVIRFLYFKYNITKDSKMFYMNMQVF